MKIMPIYAAQTEIMCCFCYKLEKIKMCVLLRWKSFYSHIDTENKHINQWTKADKASHKHIKIQLQELSCTSKEISPAHSVLPFVICGTRIKER